MIIVTGAAGFIGSCLLKRLEEEQIGPVFAIDDFSNIEKNKNLDRKVIYHKIDRNEFIENPEIYGKVDFVFHIGARTDTAEFDTELLNKLNTDYSKKIWNYCCKNSIPLVYASSAATYGMGEIGFNDDHALIPDLKPMNPYGQSKQDFDVWVLNQKETPPFWWGLKFFNVFGPNEYHKGRMASMVMHGTRQIIENGEINLFKSHVPNYQDGEQLRDFIYVKDVLDVLLFLYNNKPNSAIYNLGTGKARSWNDLANAIFKSLNKSATINYIDIPEDIRDKYQYFTEAGMEKLKSAGYQKEFTPLEVAVDEYIQTYLLNRNYY
jgi:ADP-L-glycero-D-manno-heptose 6-epimerase